MAAKNLPIKAKGYLDLVKSLYKQGFKPLPKAMKEASRIWKKQKAQK